jgi:hypothetical protein
MAYEKKYSMQFQRPIAYGDVITLQKLLQCKQVDLSYI